MTDAILKRTRAAEMPVARREGLDEEVLVAAGRIVRDVRTGGEAALRRHAEALGDVQPEQPLAIGSTKLDRALSQIDSETRAFLERVAGRIRAFAEAQLDSLRTMEMPIPGGVAGHCIELVERAGCYAPGGRYPLPSSVLMTAVTARVAGVKEVWVASPRPLPETLAAAAIAQADGVLAVGGAQAIAAMAFGVVVPACDVIVGPGNRFVSAAKHLVSDRVRIDMLAGPSELVVLADESADTSVVAADLLAQAEHAPEARVVLVSISQSVIDAVDEQLVAQLEQLPTASVARQSLRNGLAALASDMDEAVDICDRLAPEHLALHVTAAQNVADRLRHFGALFIGPGAAVVLGDYGAGPNHTLPTGGTARHTGGLSVFDFLRIRTYLRIDDAAASEPLLKDAQLLARLEGLEAHARAAGIRRAGHSANP